MVRASVADGKVFIIDRQGNRDIVRTEPGNGENWRFATISRTG
jgi:hypothetical protein